MATQAQQPLEIKPTQRQNARGFARRNSLQFGIVGVFLFIWIFLIFAAPLTYQNKEIYGSLMATIPFYGVIALPLTMLVIAQEIDLSFPSIMAIAVVAFLEIFNSTGSVLLGVIACLLTGLIAGLINGLIIVKIGIPSLIATIGTQFFWRGVALVITNAKGGSLMATKADPLHDILVGRLFGYIPMQAIWMIVVAVIVWFLLNRHRFGAHVYLIGDNANSARLMGINTDQRRIILFVLVGIAAAFGGLLASMEVSYFWPTLGEGYLLLPLAAVFLGGTPVLGGTGTVIGTFIGCFIIGAIESATVAVGLTGFWTGLIYGLIIVGSVTLHTVVRRRIRR